MSYNLFLDVSIYGVYRLANLYTVFYWSEDRGGSAPHTEKIWWANSSGTNSYKFMAAPISFWDIVRYIY